MQNPDGRQRFVTRTCSAARSSRIRIRSRPSTTSRGPAAASNHYLFDMNRDYFALSQPETQGRARVMLEWYPQVVVDLHEMGGNSTLLLRAAGRSDQSADHRGAAKSLELFGRANAAEFDQRGFALFRPRGLRRVLSGLRRFVADRSTAPSAMTYEQASARGLAFRREDGTTADLQAGVTQHFTAAITTAVTAAQNRERLLRDFLEYRRSAIALGQKGTREYLIPPGKDPSRAAAAGAAARRAGHPGQARRGGVPVRHAADAARARSSSRSRSPPAGSRATCSIPTSRWTRRS